MLHKILWFTIAITLSACAVQQQTAQSSQPESTSSIKIPKNFYAEELGQCRMNGYKGDQITASTYKDEIDLIIGFNWQEHHVKYSTSISPDHRPLSRPIAYLSAASHQAAYSKNAEDIKTVTDLIYQIAKGNQFMNTIDKKEASKTMCWGNNNDGKAPCPLHAPSLLANTMTTYIISAVWQRKNFSTEQLQVVDSYISKIYSKYIEPMAVNEDEEGFYGMANGGIGRLAYAAWKNDSKIAGEEFKYRFKQMDEHWENNGYIKVNSYRGVRGIFYHSMAVDIGLGYIALANAWGYKVPDNLYNKVKKSADLINVYIANPKDYYNFPESKMPFNSPKNPDDAEGIHTNAIAIATLMKNVAHIDMSPYSFVFDMKGRKRIRFEFTDLELGFNPKCMFPQ